VIDKGKPLPSAFPSAASIKKAPLIEWGFGLRLLFSLEIE